MIQCEEKDKQIILDYIGKDYGKCAYLYIDLKKYGLNNPHVRAWYQPDGKGGIAAVALQYYLGFHVYSRDGRFNPEDIASLIEQNRPTLVCGMKETIDRIAPFTHSYTPEYGKVLRLGKYSGIAGEKAYRAKREDLKEIAELLAEDEEMGGPYGFDALYHQLLERYDEGFGRNWVLRDDKGVVAHSATYAELDDIAVVSGGIVRPDCRGKGEYQRQLGALCRDLVSENKEVISYYYGVGGTAHRVVGFEKLGDWEKLILNDSEKGK